MGITNSCDVYMSVLITNIWCKSGSALTCLTAMLTLTELMEPSIKTFSLSLRLMITGWRSNSLLLLKRTRETHTQTINTIDP